MEQKEEEAPQEMTEAQKMAHGILMGDQYVKQQASAIYSGIVMNHYGFGMIRAHLDVMNDRRKREGKDVWSKELLNGTCKEMFTILKDESAHGMQLEHLIKLLRDTVLPGMERDLDTHRAQLRTIKESNDSKGIPTGFPALDKALGGGLKTDNVLAIAGNDVDALANAYDKLMLHFNTTHVPVTRFAMGEIENTVGVTNVPPAWWHGGCTSFHKMRDTFEVVKTPVLVIDNVAALVGGLDNKEDVRQVRKLLRAAAKRYHITIVGCALASEFGEAGNTKGFRVTTAANHVDEAGETVLFVENEKYESKKEEEPENADGNVSGGAEVAGELAGTNPGAEAGTPVGSGEDCSEDGGVGSDSAGCSAEEQADK